MGSTSLFIQLALIIRQLQTECRRKQSLCICYIASVQLIPYHIKWSPQSRTNPVFQHLISALFSVSFPMYYMYNPNTVLVKSELACFNRSLLGQQKCEHLTSRADVDSFVERGVDLADLELLMEQHSFPLGVTVSNLLRAGNLMGARKCPNLLLGQLWMGRSGCWYSLEMSTAEWLLMEHSSSVWPRRAIIECAGGREPLCSVGNESEDPAYYQAENKCLWCFCLSMKIT